MNIKENFKLVKEFDITEIQEIIASFKDEWYVNTTRQTDFFFPHGQTLSIFLYDIDAGCWEGQGYPIKEYDINPKLKESSHKIIDQLQIQFNGKVGKALYINLRAGRFIQEHCDEGFYLENVHRFHIPIITNDQVFFNVENESINMKPGFCYEFNNTKRHSVQNNGQTDRVHLMLDIIPNNIFKVL